LNSGTDFSGRKIEKSMRKNTHFCFIHIFIYWMVGIINLSNIML